MFLIWIFHIKFLSLVLQHLSLCKAKLRKYEVLTLESSIAILMVPLTAFTVKLENFLNATPVCLVLRD